MLNKRLNVYEINYTMQHLPWPHKKGKLDAFDDGGIISKNEIFTINHF